MLANAFRRALRVGETQLVPRISDLPFILPSLQGKVEFEAMDERQEDRIIYKLINGSVRAVFDRYFEMSDMEKIATAFKSGLTVETGEAVGAIEYRSVAAKVPTLSDKTRGIAGEGEAARAAAIEFILEGLHLHKRLNKHSADGRSSYSA